MRSSGHTHGVPGAHLLGGAAAVGVPQGGRSQQLTTACGQRVDVEVGHREPAVVFDELRHAARSLEADRGHPHRGGLKADQRKRILPGGEGQDVEGTKVVERIRHGADEVDPAGHVQPPDVMVQFTMARGAWAIAADPDEVEAVVRQAVSHDASQLDEEIRPLVPLRGSRCPDNAGVPRDAEPVADAVPHGRRVGSAIAGPVNEGVNHVDAKPGDTMPGHEVVADCA